MIIVIVGFVGMIVLGWGMDITDRRTSVDQGVVARINGEKISYDLYNSYIQNRRQSLGNKQESSYATERRLHSEVWNEIVNQTIMAQEIKKRKISYTDKELLNYILNNPPQVVFQIPLFQEDGRFSFSKYQGFIRNPDNFNNPQTAALLQGLELQAKNTLPFIKFQEVLTGSVIVPESHVRERWDLEKQKRTIQWALVSDSRFGDAIKDVPQQDVEAYYNEHKDDYKREENRTLDFVFFSLKATAQDSAEVFERAQMLAQRAKNGEDFADLANGYSMDPGNDDGMGNRRGGDLGYFGKGAMVKAFEDVAFGMKPGEISDPFLSPFGYHIVKVDSLKYKEDDKKKATSEVDQVKARHILLKLDPSTDTRDDLENRVTAFHEKVSKGGDFAQAAQEAGLEINRTARFNKESAYIASLGQNTDILVNRAFSSDVGDVLTPYWTDQGVFVLRVAEIYAAGIAPLEEVVNQVRQEVRKEKGHAEALELANKIDSLMKSGKTLEEAAAADSSNIIAVQTETVTRVQRVRTIGAKSPLVAAAFQLKNPGESTGPVSMEQGVGIAVLQSIEPLDPDQYEKDHDQIYEQLVREEQNMIISRTMEDLLDKAKIVDHRYMYYNL